MTSFSLLTGRRRGIGSIRRGHFLTDSVGQSDKSPAFMSSGLLFLKNLLGNFGRCPAAVVVENRGRNGEIEQRGRKQPAKDNQRNGVQDFLSRFTLGQDERNEPENRRQRGHEDRSDTFLAASDYHFTRELFAFLRH